MHDRFTGSNPHYLIIFFEVEVEVEGYGKSEKKKCVVIIKPGTMCLKVELALKYLLNSNFELWV